MFRVRMFRSTLVATLASAMLALLTVATAVAGEPGPPFPR
jgi:hypothetical protein